MNSKVPEKSDIALIVVTRETAVTSVVKAMRSPARVVLLVAEDGRYQGQIVNPQYQSEA